MNEIFLSYRRADEKGTTGRLFDHLVLAFGGRSASTNDTALGDSSLICFRTRSAWSPHEQPSAST